jgi:hypothetical protein
MEAGGATGWMDEPQCIPEFTPHVTLMNSHAKTQGRKV